MSPRVRLTLFAVAAAALAACANAPTAPRSHSRPALDGTTCDTTAGHTETQDTTSSCFGGYIPPHV